MDKTTTDAFEALERLHIDKMTDAELDVGFALALSLFTHCNVRQIGDRVEVDDSGQWRAFSPTSSWEDFGHGMENVPMVIGSHNIGEGFTPDERYFSAHAFISGTSHYSRGDIRTATARSATAYAIQMIDCKRRYATA